MQDIKPKFTHDCAHCIFLGHHDGEDLYVHASTENEISNTVISRHGDEPGDYSSGLFASFGQMPLLTKARLLAQERGVLAYPRYEALSGVTLKSPPEMLSEFRQAWATQPEMAVVLEASAGDVDGATFEAGLTGYLAHLARQLGGHPPAGTPAERLSWFIRTLHRLVEKQDIPERFKLVALGRIAQAEMDYAERRKPSMLTS